MPQKVIIDGYNVIFADDELRRIVLKDRRRARQEFVRRVADYAGGRQIRATIVFDGRGRISDGEAVVPGRLQVLYSAENQTADELILQTVERSGNARAYIVVSSDRGHVVTPARTLGCSTMGSRAFIERMRGAAESGAESDREEEPVDTDYWLDQFGSDADP